MSIQLELWQLITLLIAFFGAVAGFGKIILGQIDKRLDERFSAQDRAREEGAKSLRESFNSHIAEEKTQDARITDVEKRINTELQTIGQRLTGVETAIEHGFGRGDVESIYNRINEVAEDLAQLKGEFRGVADQLRTLINRITEKGLS